MTFSIHDKETELMVIALAESSGHNPDEVVTEAIRRHWQAEQKRRMVRAKALEIIERSGSRPVLDPRTPEEIVGYDKAGLP